MPCLGFHIQNDGETHNLWEEARKSLWKAYFAQTRSSDVAHKVPLFAKLKNLDLVVRPGSLDSHCLAAGVAGVQKWRSLDCNSRRRH